jgi:hypothetical protein
MPGVPAMPFNGKETTNGYLIRQILSIDYGLTMIG